MSDCSHDDLPANEVPHPAPAPNLPDTDSHPSPLDAADELADELTIERAADPHAETAPEPLFFYHPAPDPNPPPLPRPTREALYLFLFKMVLFFIIGAPLQLSLGFNGLPATELACILLPALVYIRLKRLPARQALRLNPVPAGILIRSVVLGVTGWCAIIVIKLLLERYTERYLGHMPDRMYDLLPQHLSQLPWWLLVGCLMPGICEEIFYRGAIQGNLERTPWRGIVLSALLFAAGHMRLWDIVPIFLLGVGQGTLASRTNSLFPSMICHAIINFLSGALVVYRCQLLGLKPSDSAMGSGTHTLAIALTVGAGLFIFAALEFSRATVSLAAHRPILPFASPIQLPRALRVTLRAVATFGIGAIIVVIFGVRMFRVTNEECAPALHCGDRALTWTLLPGHLGIHQGNVISFYRHNYIYLRRVREVFESGVRVDDSSTTEGRYVLDQEIRGKVIRKFRGP